MRLIRASQSLDFAVGRLHRRNSPEPVRPKLDWENRANSYLHSACNRLASAHATARAFPLEEARDHCALTTWAMSLLWVNRVGLTLSPPLPVYPDERTSSDRPDRSVSCQHRTYASKFAAIEQLRASKANSGIAPLIATGPTFPFRAAGGRYENV
jgi:hypothetical protein